MSRSSYKIYLQYNIKDRRRRQNVAFYGACENQRSTRSTLNNFYRHYAFKSDLKIKWNRPEKISCTLPEKSGDNSGLPQMDYKQFIIDFRGCKELETADETVQSMFRLENNPKFNVSREYRLMFVREVQRHNLDFGSMEAKIARMTATIRRYQEIQKEFPRNLKLKVQLKEMIDKRKKFLKYLRRWDYKRFEWLLEKLDLTYKSPPAEFHWVTRKESLVKLTNTYCEKIKQERLLEYRNELENQQIPFLEKKIKNLEFIRNEQEECQVQITVTDDDIKKVRNQLEQLKKAKREAEILKDVEND